MEDAKTETVSAKIPIVIGDKMREIIKNKGYMGESDFIRDAIKEKVGREA